MRDEPHRACVHVVACAYGRVSVLCVVSWRVVFCGQEPDVHDAHAHSQNTLRAHLTNHYKTNAGFASESCARLCARRAWAQKKNLNSNHTEATSPSFFGKHLGLFQIIWKLFGLYHHLGFPNYLETIWSNIWFLLAIGPLFVFLLKAWCERRPVLGACSRY